MALRRIALKTHHASCLASGDRRQRRKRLLSIPAIKMLQVNRTEQLVLPIPRRFPASFGIAQISEMKIFDACTMQMQPKRRF